MNINEHFNENIYNYDSDTFYPIFVLLKTLYVVRKKN